MKKYTIQERVRMARQNPKYWKECFDLLLEEHRIAETRLSRAEALLERAKDMIGEACRTDACTSDYCIDRKKFISDCEAWRNG